jgi:hypothetical protein
VRVVSRRSFLLGSAAAVALASCGSSGSGAEPSSSGDTAAADNGGTTTDAGFAVGGGTSPNQVVLIRRFAPKTLVTGSQRVPVVLGDVNGLLPLESTPPTLTARILDPNGAVAVDSVTVDRHGAELQQPFYPFLLTLATAGDYQLQIKDQPSVTTTIDVSAPADVPIPQIGAPLPPFDTPTVKDHRGVDPICTRDPACPLHAVSLSQALSAGKPVAYLIGTPAYCQTAVCGPVLDLLLTERANRPDFAMVHAEVYTDSTIETVAPAVTAYHMNFEPALFIADAKGTLVARLDSIYDAQELKAALDLAAAPA